MKKLYASISLLIFAISAQAQLTQANHAPANTDTYDTYQCDSVGPGGSGAGTVWNFAVNTHSSIVKTVLASTVNNPTYPNADIAQGSSSNNLSYLKSSATTLKYYGGNISVGPLVMTLNYTTSPAVFASYPMSLNTTSTAATGGSLAVTQPLSASGTFTGTSVCIADGTGTLTIAGLTYTDVIRTVVSQTINFTTNVASGTLFQNNYQYYSNGIKAPIVSIETSTATIPLLTSSSQTVVTRLKLPPPTVTTSIAKSNVSDYSFKAFPNPASTELSFSSTDRTARTVAVFDVTGQLIREVTMTDGKSNLDVSELNKGLYIYRVNSDGGKTLHTGKFTVVH